MPDSVRVLGFDTSAAYCAAALFSDGEVVATRHEDMARGQAERLMPLLAEVLDEAGVAYANLTAIGVGVGPGNFTGVRLSVSAARGLALALGIPTVGVSLMDALALGTDGPLLTSLDARRDQIYLQRHGRGAVPDLDLHLADLAGLPAELSSHPGMRCIGHRAAELASSIGGVAGPAAYAPASAIARIAAERSGGDAPRPAPIYIRPADAAPPRQAAPVLLP